MARNIGRTSLKRKRRNEDPMRDFVRMPAELRLWIATAILPWRPRSVQRAFERAVARTQDRSLALREIDMIQQRMIARDARKVWGKAYPR